MVSPGASLCKLGRLFISPLAPSARALFKILTIVNGLPACPTLQVHAERQPLGLPLVRLAYAMTLHDLHVLTPVDTEIIADSHSGGFSLRVVTSCRASRGDRCRRQVSPLHQVRTT